MFPEKYIYKSIPSYRLDESSFQYPTPDKIKIELKPHQKAALYRAKQIEDSNGFETIDTNLIQKDDPKLYSELSSLTPEALNAKLKMRKYPQTNFARIGQFYDNVGAGKSLEALSLIASGFEYKPKNFTKLSSNYYRRFKKINYEDEDYEIVPFNYLLVPHNLVKQWQNYIDTQTSLTYITFNKKKNTEEISVEDLKKKLDENNYDIILVSSTNHNTLIDKLDKAYKLTHKRLFARLFVDELHTMKLPAGRGENLFYFVWALSATNSNYANHNGLLGDIASCINYSRHEFIDIKCDTNFVKKSFELPEPVSETILCKARRIFKIMSSVLSPHIQDMLVKDDIQGVMEALGIETFSEKNLINNITQDIQEKIENLQIDLESTQKKKYKNKKDQDEAIEKIKAKIKYEEDKIKSIEERVKAEDMDPITYAPIENPVLTPCCKNKYDLDSILNWFKHTHKTICPMCRANINHKKLIYIKDVDTDEDEPKPKVISPTSKEYKTKEHNKIENLDYILKNKIPPNSSILIFSDHESKFNEIKDVVEKDNRGELKQLIGQGSYISKLIEEFKEKKRQTLFLNARFYGSGLNLETTDYIILMHKMHPDTEVQVIGRAQRPGRTSQLKIFKVYYENE